MFVYSCDDVLGMLDSLLSSRDGAWWDGFFADTSRAVPFFTRWPDENLAEWFGEGRLGRGRVLELGCGQGRNAIYLAGLGCSVDAVDFAPQAIKEARKRAEQAGRRVHFRCCSIFDAEFADGSYDLVYDSGCFHHLPPHRRKTYVELVQRVLKPGGSYGLVCFRPQGGSGFTDLQVYERGSLGGGLGYTEEELRALWDRSPFSVRVLRQMDASREACFGEDFLWVLLGVKDLRQPQSKIPTCYGDHGSTSPTRGAWYSATRPSQSPSQSPSRTPRIPVRGPTVSAVASGSGASGTSRPPSRASVWSAEPRC